MMIRNRVLLEMGSRPPRGWGLAWRDLRTGRAVALPIPLNLLAGLVRRIYLSMQAGISPAELDALRSENAARLREVEVLRKRIDQILDVKPAEGPRSRAGSDDS